MAAKDVKQLKKDTSGIAGKRIESIVFDEFPDGRGGVTCNPTIVLDDGSQLTFKVDETETGVYGVRILREKGLKL